MSDQLSQSTCLEMSHPKTDEQLNLSVELRHLVGKLSSGETLLTEVQRKVPTCPRSFLVINVCNQGKTLCSPCTFLYRNRFDKCGLDLYGLILRTLLNTVVTLWLTLNTPSLLTICTTVSFTRSVLFHGHGYWIIIFFGTYITVKFLSVTGLQI